MKKLEEYSIFTKYYHFLNYMLDKIEKYPRSVKFTLGDRIVNLLYDIMDNLITAIYTKKRYELLVRINIFLERLRIYIRISLGRKYISIPSGEYIFGEINEIGKMLGGWLKVEASK